MNRLVQLSHPAHFHLYKNAIKNWQDNGHQVHVLIKTKDILEELCQNSQIPYHNILPIAHRKSKFGVLWDMLVRDWKIFWFCIKHKIDILTGSTPEVAHVSKILGRYSVNTGEDDMAVIPAFAKVAGPFFQTILSPFVCDNGKYNNKSVKYPGYQKLAYLHPNYFTPNHEIVEGYGIDLSKPYFILRFASLNAHHDDGVQGINATVAQRLVDMLKPFGQIFISSERELEPQFEPYRLRINPLDIHHLLAFASLYIGDSQSMAVEASMLGTPCLRFNDFVGRKKISVLEELEHVYQLTNGISSHNAEQLYSKIEEILAMPDARATYQARKEKMLAEKIDVTKFWTWFIENYPESAVPHDINSEFWNQFK